MAFANRAHIQLADLFFRLDPDAPMEIQSPTYDHRTESLFRRGLDVDGVPGAQNLREDRLIQHNTDWSGGEGQKVLRDVQSQSSRFFRSEGVDTSIPGELTLLRSTNRNSPADASGGTQAIVQGSAYSDITGTSATVNTDDQRLSLEGDVIESSSFTQASGFTNPIQADFYLYKEGVQTTTIQGSSMVGDPGGHVDGTDFDIGPGATCKTVLQTTLPNEAITVTFNLTREDEVSNSPMLAKCYVSDITGHGEWIIASTTGTMPPITTGSPEPVTFNVTFTPQEDHNYRFKVKNTSSDGHFLVDNLVWNLSSAPTQAIITVRDHTGSTVLSTQTVSVSSEASTLSASVAFNAATGNAYRFRVEYDDGPQRLILDKSVTTILSATAAIQFDNMELGVGGNVVAIGKKSGAAPEAWTYDFDNETWDVYNAQIADAAGYTCIGMAHTDAYEYALFDNGVVIQFSGSNDADYIAPITGASGICICQNRLFVLAEDPAGDVTLTTFALDADVSAAVTPVVATATVADAHVTSDVNLRQRMVGTPYGAFFFVNYSYDCVVYKADSSAATFAVPEIARLEVGSRGSSIAHTQGITFVAAQTFAEAGETPTSTLWSIDQNAVPKIIGSPRPDADDSSASPIIDMQVWSKSLWMLQGRYMFRYSLQTGGLTCQRELTPTDETYARAIAVVAGHSFALFAQESVTQTNGTIWVTGSTDTYGQSSVEGGNSTTNSIYDFALPGEDKLLRHIQVTTDELPANTSVSVEVQVNQDGVWIAMGSHSDGKESILMNTDWIVYRSLQVRTTLSTADGLHTPTLKSVIVDSLPLVQEEMFDLIVLVEDEDSGDHIDGQMLSAGEISERLWAIQNAGLPTTLRDGTIYDQLDLNPEYLVRLENSRHTVDMQKDGAGEGRYALRLRVL